MIAVDNIQVDGKFIYLEAINARSVKITTTHSNIKEVVLDNKLVSLNIANAFLLDLRDKKFYDRITFNMGHEDDREWHAVYWITDIKKLGEGMYIASSMRLNNVSLFILPMLGYDREWFGWDWSLANAYIGTPSQLTLGKSFEPGEIEYNIALLYKFYYLNKYFDLDKRLKSLPQYITNYSHDFLHVMFNFKIPKQYQQDFVLIMNSQYSLLSSKLKKAILRFHGFNENSDMAKILSNDTSYRKQLELRLGNELPSNVELFQQIDLAKESILTP